MPIPTFINTLSIPLKLHPGSGRLSSLKMATTPPHSSAVTLYSSPVSNYSARVRYLVYRKNLDPSQVEICSPMDLGGLKTEDYLAVNPLGKIPSVVVNSSDPPHFLYESSVICGYLSEVFQDVQPSFIPSSPEKRALANLITNILDVYLGPLHPCMYKRGYEDREEGAKKMHVGFDALEQAMSEKGPYAVGEDLSIADCCLWGNWPFYEYMLPTFFGWSPTDGRPKLTKWVKHMRGESEASRKMYKEVFDGLEAWWNKGRWEEMSMKALTPKPTMPF